MKAAHNGKNGKNSKNELNSKPSEKAPRYAAANPLREPVAEKTIQMHTDDLSSDDEAPKNTVGNVPREWYADYDHIGYDVSGKAIAKSKRADGIDRFLQSQDDPNFKWTIYDEQNDEEVVLSKRDVQIIQRLRGADYAHPEFDPYSIEYNTTDTAAAEKELYPLHGGTEPKRRFLPSRWEAIRINKIVKAIREGRFHKKEAKSKEQPVYLLWGDDDAAIGYEARRGAPPPLPAPKMALPGHAASYNPPPEYLMTEEEKEAWQAAAPSERPLDFIPRRFTNLRSVPLYAAGIRERFERCLDLYLCPRAAGKKSTVDPDSLLPKLPDPSQLRPFPTTQVLNFNGHTGRVRCTSIDPTGQWLASGSDDQTLRLWELATGRCTRTWNLGAVVQAVSWNPSSAIQIIAAAVDEDLVLIYPGTCRSSESAQATFDALTGPTTAGDGDDDDGKGSDDEDDDGSESDSEADDEGENKKKKQDGSAAAGNRSNGVPLRSARWNVAVPLASADDLLPSRMRATAAAAQVEQPAAKKGKASASSASSSSSAAVRGYDAGSGTGVIVTVTHPYPLRRVAWHRKGDYCATVSPSAPTGSVMIHQLSKHASQCPLNKNPGQVQTVCFHPGSKPLLYVANQRSVRVYNLVKEGLVMKLDAGVKWISSLEVHPSGDHVVIGSYDHRTVWFDTELSTSPYKTLRYHSQGVRKVTFHPSYPLMATASDDGTVHIFHARVFNDFLQNPVIVPVKILRGHTVGSDGLGVLDATWHPTQPWLITAGADHSINLWHNVP